MVLANCPFFLLVSALDDVPVQAAPVVRGGEEELWLAQAKRSGIHDQMSRISLALTISEEKVSGFRASCTFRLETPRKQTHRKYVQDPDHVAERQVKQYPALPVCVDFQCVLGCGHDQFVAGRAVLDGQVTKSHAAGLKGQEIHLGGPAALGQISHLVPVHKAAIFFLSHGAGNLLDGLSVKSGWTLRDRKYPSKANKRILCPALKATVKTQPPNT
ncbi:hypothetical protein F7725_014178 [Dissostichus mawsoni]|uniref:Uncharacterized protein n=1 Tax=Dissostichus mawsoni TaxID=36200 RepID=A0A7J5YVL4_DISMA|nr:hypothetical protein F7725_014178 [Dissostichus mawsoni]